MRTREDKTGNQNQALPAKAGRPKGSTREQTASKKLDFLKTRTWVWTSSARLSEGGDQPTSYRLSRAANQRRKDGYGPTPEAWDRWKNKERGVTQATVESLWSETSDAFSVGPWVGPWSMLAEGTPCLGSTFKEDVAAGAGGYVPLWEQIRGSANPKEAWKKIPKSAWEAWAPQRPLGFGKISFGKISLALKNSELIPGKDEFRSSVTLHNFLQKIAREITAPALLALAASLCLARLEGREKILFFDPRFQFNTTEQSFKYSLSSKQRPRVLNALKEIDIQFDEIALISGEFGLELLDCGSMTLDQYKNHLGLKELIVDAPRKEEDWRAIFEPQIPGVTRGKNGTILGQREEDF
ncbi:MAG: hypothetical protein SCI25_03500 [Desulfuromonadales bacterium]|nr:hypothetical protein [Desulfuromonadales bacterium]MDW7757292.1 hypothetical protein [Desulfuromonadales bacterium]